jgi:hypothetical protein
VALDSGEIRWTRKIRRFAASTGGSLWPIPNAVIPRGAAASCRSPERRPWWRSPIHPVALTTPHLIGYCAGSNSIGRRTRKR